jgi:hypothetical protein
LITSLIGHAPAVARSQPQPRLCRTVSRSRSCRLCARSLMGRRQAVHCWGYASATLLRDRFPFSPTASDPAMYLRCPTRLPAQLHAKFGSTTLLEPGQKPTSSSSANTPKASQVAALDISLLSKKQQALAGSRDTPVTHERPSRLNWQAPKTRHYAAKLPTD